jgi:hypothetical protein
MRGPVVLGGVSEQDGLRGRAVSVQATTDREKAGRWLRQCYGLFRVASQSQCSGSASWSFGEVQGWHVQLQSDEEWDVFASWGCGEMVIGRGGPLEKPSGIQRFLSCHPGRNAYIEIVNALERRSRACTGVFGNGQANRA